MGLAGQRDTHIPSDTENKQTNNNLPSLPYLRILLMCLDLCLPYHFDLGQNFPQNLVDRNCWLVFLHSLKNGIGDKF